MKILDLFSGLGGWSEAFVRHGCEVIRIENNPLLQDVAHTQLKDVLEVRDYLVECQARGLPIQKPDIIMASPPCYYFSNAYSAPKSLYVRKYGNLDKYDPPMNLLEATLDIIKIVKPKYWIIENVVGATRYFEKYLGKPKQIIGAYVLWGTFPAIHCPADKLPTKASKDKRHSPIRSNYRAEIPLPLSMALLTAILEQTSLFDFA
tara:strand:- start:11 stop:625 length:615 start_codon:yes stop_codon:yes gene_type:complete